jgi:hypothetical protein
MDLKIIIKMQSPNLSMGVLSVDHSLKIAMENR